MAGRAGSGLGRRRLLMPPVTCTPCRLTIDSDRYRVYSDGSVSSALTLAEAERLGLKTVREVLEYESIHMARLTPDSLQAKTIRREASRRRRNRGARERYQTMRDLGMTRTRDGQWE
jgi:hypothetical protein